MINKSGFLLINKEKGMTSFDVIRKLKKMGYTKLGHTGTLDPNTEGLLVVAINHGTKFIERLTRNSKKEYIATMKFGIKTSTADITGEVVEEKEYKFNEEEIKKTIESFIKTYEQVPPLFSAKKINGKRAYKLGFENKQVDMSSKKKEVSIFDIDILSVDGEKNEVVIKCLVSKGTYIRSLIEDIAFELNTVATMKDLIRTKTDGFTLDDAKSVSDFTTDNFINLTEYLKENFKSLIIDEKIAYLVKNGVQIKNENIVKKFDSVGEEEILLIDKETKKMIALYQKNDSSYKSIFYIWGKNDL